MPFAIDNGIKKKQLETSQREAILASGKNILVNAGAGSGKTFTILAKILHILDQNLAKPEEIIVVAYNTNVAIDLRDRLENLAKTFPNLENKIKRVSIDKYKICPECDEKIVQALHFCVKKKKYISRQIHTFHSYCYDLLKQNEKMQHSDGTTSIFYNVGIPALTGLGYDEEKQEFAIVNTCPGAGECKTFCYALKGG